MNQSAQDIDEKLAAKAFNRQASLFDSLYGPDKRIQYKRDRVRQHILVHLQPHSKLLELNCGTGEDAIYFATRGHSVHATDISAAMLEITQQKAGELLPGGTGRISQERCSFLQLEMLQNKGPFDHIYSNFGGLNCTGELKKVLSSFDSLLKPGGTVTLVIISKFSLWESLLLFKGKFSTAFRRFFSAKGRKAHIEGVLFKCWYYSPSYIRSYLKNYSMLDLEGLCTVLPPSYIEGFADKHPKLYRFLEKRENRYRRAWPWRNMGDYFIISMKKKP